VVQFGNRVSHAQLLLDGSGAQVTVAVLEVSIATTHRRRGLPRYGAEDCPATAQRVATLHCRATAAVSTLFYGGKIWRSNAA